MHEVTIDPDIYKKDGLYTMACTRVVFRQEEKGAIPQIIDPEACYHK